VTATEWTGVSRSAGATAALGRALGEALVPPPRGGGVVSLHGELGAGKTVLAGGLARGLGVPDAVPVTSPTFVVAKAYRGRVRLDHVDAYMVRSLSELEAAGFEDLGGEGRVLCVEWGERVAGALPEDRLDVTLVAAPLPAEVPARDDGAEPPRRVAILATGRRSAAVLEKARAGLDAAAGAP
jgi:tRNA threonylcarbamoyladenosine biosynthesis protein TsaE